MDTPDGTVPPWSALLVRALEAIAQGVVITNWQEPDNPIIYVNPAFERLTGYDASEIVGANCRFLQGPETDRGVLEELKTAIATSCHFHGTLLNYRKDGSSFLNELTVSPVWDVSGRVTHFVGTQFDVTERHAAQVALRDSEERYRLLAENATDLILRIGLDGSTVYVSPSCVDVLGLAPGDLLGRSLAEIIHPENQAQFVGGLGSLASEGHDQQTLLYRARHQSGETIWLEDRRRLVRDPKGAPREIVSVVRNVSDRVRLEERLRQQASEDGLTGLANRRAFDERLEEEWRRARRGGRWLGLLCLDVDHFKQYNDHLGHVQGDACLRRIGEVLRERCRMSDFVARTGGEEFCIILPDTDPAGAAVVAEGVRAAVEGLNLVHPGSPGGTVTASIGVASLQPSMDEAATTLLNRADQALYEAKRAGRNRIVSATPLRSAA
ncbi:MAG TPA: diguanylate cyclase [Microvirga sp.]|jgi:diguanylate cyclase (GGDEF)-like protein/PAS domain S-box-containing protein|nr:diguanylate cyclase [Microvirga sp.]